MNWLLRRVIVIWLVMCGLCIAAMVLGHLDHTPNALQRLGFDVCDGDPCFRGVKPGMTWEELKKKLPDVFKSTNIPLNLLANLPSGVEVSIAPTKGTNGYVESVYLSVKDFYAQYPLTAGEILAQYGMPCDVFLDYARPEQMAIIYPHLVANVNLTASFRTDRKDFRLEINSRITDFDITTHVERWYGLCDNLTEDFWGPWRGFTSAPVYLERNLRDIGATPTP